MAKKTPKSPATSNRIVANLASLSASGLAQLMAEQPAMAKMLKASAAILVGNLPNVMQALVDSAGSDGDRSPQDRATYFKLLGIMSQRGDKPGANEALIGQLKEAQKMTTRDAIEGAVEAGARIGQRAAAAVPLQAPVIDGRAQTVAFTTVQHEPVPAGDQAAPAPSQPLDVVSPRSIKGRYAPL